jgi:hypothetical protein
MTRMDHREDPTRGLRRRFAVPGALLVCLATAALVAAPAPAQRLIARAHCSGA